MRGQRIGIVNPARNDASSLETASETEGLFGGHFAAVTKKERVTVSPGPIVA